jgi:hypothetical protein
MKVTFTYNQMQAFAVGYFHARTDQHEQNDFMTPLEIWSYHRGYDTGVQVRELETAP